MCFDHHGRWKNQGRIENIKGIDQLLQIISNRDSIINDEEIIKIIGGLQTMYEVNEEFSIIAIIKIIVFHITVLISSQF